MVSAAAAYLKGKQALVKASAVVARQKRIRIAAPQGGSYPQPTLTSNGTTQTSGTDRIICQLNSDYAWIAPVVFNSSPASGSGIMTSPGNAVTIRMAIEQGGTTTPRIVQFNTSTLAAVSSGGKTGHIIGDGEYLIGKPCRRGVMLKNSYQVFRFYKTVTAGQKWPLSYGYGNYNQIDASTSGNAGTTDQASGTTVTTGADLTYTGPATFGAFAGGSYYWAPAFIIGEQLTPAVTTLIVGDSVSAGFGDKAGRGYLVRALELAGMTGQYLNCGIPASVVTNLTQNQEIPQLAADYVDFILWHQISNDFNTGVITDLAGAQAAVLSVCQNLLRSHSQMGIATCLPRTTTTDAGATYTGQTKLVWEPLRISYNNWLRDKTPNGAKAWLNARIKVGSVFAIFDACPYVERNADGSNIVLDANGQQAAGTGGYFVAGMSTDATHPNSALAAIAAAAVPTGLMTLPS